MKIVKLYGHLGKKFGSTHKFDINTPAEAIRALKANFPEFTNYIIEHSLPGYKILVGSDNRSNPELLHYPAESTIKIVPVVQGSGGNWGMIVIGVVLIAAATVLTAGAGSMAAAAIEANLAAGTEAAIAAGAAVETIASVAATGMMAVGVSLALSGVSSLLFSPSSPTANQNTSADQISSTHFNGPINLAQQGNPVPVAYGKVRVGSQVVSAGITTSKVT